MASASRQRIKPITWLLVAGAAVVVFVLFLFFFGLFGTVIDQLKPATYFFLLIPLALMAAAFLFGAMRSHARYSGKVYGGTLELGGPVVLLIIIIYLGYKFRPQATAPPFNLTLNVFSNNSSATLVPEGELHVFYGTAKPKIKINDGQAVLPEVPPGYRGKPIRILPVVQGFSPAPITDTLPLNSNTLDVYLQQEAEAVTVRGIVKNNRGEPVEHAVLVFADGLFKDSTDAYGNFAVTLPYKDGTETTLRVYNEGRLRYDNLVTLSPAASMNIQIR